ncbi:MAG: DNA-3-methyladenine glycosylase 2 family protein [Leptolyngbyaceae cyanobacterium CRU_2_3]|nr:DNA-3-methyladenine glycosylase 2 family protein [Leptolyngbyaceae cyanobacterium CRU_2_3]
MQTLDPVVCYRVFQTKDVRFDGQVFIAVSSTRIYCRPICPANTPKPENCTFYPSAAAAQSAGFRPCLRCRPELSPRLSSYVGTASTVSRALRLIAAGTLDEGTVGALATRLGMSDRHLRQLFRQHLGTSPIAIAQTRRIQFAKQLIDETQLPMTDVAIAAGFGSIRRFNDAIAKIYGRSPSELRRQTSATTETIPSITLKLPFSPPYNWTALMQFLMPRATPGLEVASLERYQRAIGLDGLHGWIEVRPVAGQNYLLAQIHFPKVARLSHIVERLSNMFDLSSNIAEISAHFQTDPILSPVVALQPGLRIPGVWDAFEMAVRAILGQQVSVAAATTLAGRLVTTYGEPLQLAQPDAHLRFVFPRPEVLVEALAEADLTPLGITKPRAKAIASLAAVAAQNPQFFSQFHSLEDAVQKLCQLPGIGEWTAQYIAMRALREPDAFPTGDLGLLRSMAAIGYPVTKAQLAEHSQAWRPWRAYAALHLWSVHPALLAQSPLQPPLSTACCSNFQLNGVPVIVLTASLRVGFQK